MNEHQVSAFLAQKRIERILRSIGSILLIDFSDQDGLLFGGADWTLTLGGELVEISDAISGSEKLQPLVGRRVSGFRIVSPETCELVIPGAVFRFRSNAHEGYEMGAEIFSIYRRKAAGGSSVCLISAPFTPGKEFLWADGDSVPADQDAKRPPEPGRP